MARADDDIDAVPAGREQHHRRDDHADGADRVGGHLEEGPADVQILRAMAMKHAHHEQVHAQPDDANRQHRPAIDRGGARRSVRCPRRRLYPAKPSIRRTCSGTTSTSDAGVPVAALQVRGAPRDERRDERQEQTCRVDEHVRRIGGERKRAGGEARAQLDRREGQREGQSQDEDPAGRGRGRRLRGHESSVAGDHPASG